MFKIIKYILFGLIAIGVIRAIARYNSGSELEGAGDLVASFVGAIEDITYRWIPYVVEFFGDLFSALAGLLG